MNRNIFLKLCLIPALLLVCCILICPMDAFATSTDPEYKAIELTEEERAFCERTDEITIGCPVNNCPLLFQNEKTGQVEGITIDILNLISEETGLTFRYQALPSGNITYEDLQKLGIDMTAGVEYNEINTHASGIAMTNPYMHAEKVFVCKKGEIF